MAKKIVKKRKLKVFNFLLVLIILVGLFFGVKFYLDIPVKNIVVKRTSYLNDDYILELAGIKNYPHFWAVSNSKIKKKLEASPYIESVKVTKSFFHKITIDVVESRALFFDTTAEKVVLSNKKKVKENEYTSFRIPRVINYVPDNKYNKFIKGMNNIKEDVLEKISDIEYQPNDLDKDRFLLYMDDGNMVYLTLTKFKMINYYNRVLSQLENHKGILYLDNGNHFQIKE